MRPKKRGAGRALVGMVCGAGEGLDVCGCGQNFSNSCAAGLNFAGAGRERTQNFNPRRTLVCAQLQSDCLHNLPQHIHYDVNFPRISTHKGEAIEGKW